MPPQPVFTQSLLKVPSPLVITGAGKTIQNRRDGARTPIHEYVLTRTMTCFFLGSCPGHLTGGGAKSNRARILLVWNAQVERVSGRDFDSGIPVKHPNRIMCVASVWRAAQLGSCRTGVGASKAIRPPSIHHGKQQ